MLSFYAPKDIYQRNEEPATISLLSARKVLSDTDKKQIMERTYNNYAIVYAQSGSFCCYINDENVKLADGEMLCLGKYARFAIQSDGEREGAFFVIEFNASDLSFIDLKKGKVKTFAQSNIRRLVLDIYSESKKTQAGRSIAEAYLLALLLTLSQMTDAHPSDVSVYEKASRYIIDHAHLDLRVQDIADALGYNKDYLGRLFLRYGGKTLKEAISEERLSQAKELLVSTSYDLKKISALLSFSGTNTFVKFFKYHTKTTPTEYRKLKQRS